MSKFVKVSENIIFRHFVLTHFTPMFQFFSMLSGILKTVYCVRLLHAITSSFSKYFQILYIFAQFFKNLVLFQYFFGLFVKHCTHALTFKNRPWLSSISQHLKWSFLRKQLNGLSWDLS